MDTLNIRSEHIITYRTDILESGKYYINPNCFNIAFSSDNYDIGGSQGIGNPIITNRLLLYGNFYYKELLFENNAVGIPYSSWLTSNEFDVADRIWAEAEEGFIYLWWSGYRNINDNITPVEHAFLVKVEIDKLPDYIWSSIDFSAGFFVHTSEDPSDSSTIRSRFNSPSQARQYISTLSNTYLKTYLEQNNFSIGFANVRQQWVTSGEVVTGEIRIAYKDINGQFHDFLSSYDQRVIIYPPTMMNFLIPFISSTERFGAEVANYPLVMS